METSKHKISNWTNCFDDIDMEYAFRQQSLQNQRQRSIFFALMIAVIPAIPFFREISEIFSFKISSSAEFAPRLLCSILSLIFAIFIAKIRDFRVLDFCSVIYGLVLIGFTIFLMFVRTQSNSVMTMAGLIGTVSFIYFFVPLSATKVLVLAVSASAIGLIAILHIHNDLKQDWLGMLLWIIALNALGYYGVRSQNRYLRNIFWQNNELHRQRTELQRANELEKESFQRFVQFTQMISHEFRNSLAIVKSNAQLMQLAQSLGSTLDTDAPSVIELAVSRMESLFARWLETERTADSEFEPSFNRVSLSRVFDQIRFQAPVSSQHCLILHSVPDLELQIDEALISLALQNIVANAIKYSPDGGVISVSARVVENYIEIAISDNGIGINSSELEAIFDKYYRSNHDRGIPGFGLGLYIVRRIIALHQGTVTAEHNIGSGSIFKVKLPFVC